MNKLPVLLIAAELFVHCYGRAMILSGEHKVAPDTQVELTQEYKYKASDKSVTTDPATTIRYVTDILRLGQTLYGNNVHDTPPAPHQLSDTVARNVSTMKPKSHAINGISTDSEQVNGSPSTTTELPLPSIMTSSTATSLGIGPDGQGKTVTIAVQEIDRPVSDTVETENAILIQSILHEIHLYRTAMLGEHNSAAQTGHNSGHRNDADDHDKDDDDDDDDDGDNDREHNSIFNKGQVDVNGHRNDGADSNDAIDVMNRPTGHSSATTNSRRTDDDGATTNSRRTDDDGGSVDDDIIEDDESSDIAMNKDQLLVHVQQMFRDSDDLDDSLKQDIQHMSRESLLRLLQEVARLRKARHTTNPTTTRHSNDDDSRHQYQYYHRQLEQDRQRTNSWSNLAMGDICCSIG